MPAVNPRGRKQTLATVGVVVAAVSLIWMDIVLAAFLVGALIGGVLVVRRPILGVLFFAATIPVENLVVLEGATLTRLLGMGVFTGWIIHKLLYRESWKELFQSLLMVSASFFIAFVALSVLWAREPDITRVGTFQLLQLFALALLLLDVLRDWKQVELMVRLLLIGALVAAVVTLRQYFAGGLSRAGEDVGGGINETAQVLITLIPFTFYMFRSSQTLLWRFLGTVTLAAMIGAVAVTFSRMSLLLLPPLLLSQYWQTLRNRRGTGWLLTTTVAIGVAAAALLPWSPIANRISTILPYVEATVEEPGGQEVVASSGRGYHLRVGLAIFADHPAIGVGYGNYGDYFLRDYQFKVEGGEKLWQSRRSPHSSNIGIMADLGLIGLALWALLLGTGLFAILRAWRYMREVAYGSDGFFLVQAVAYAYLVQVVAYTWYLPNQKQKLFWLVLGLTHVMYRLARELATTPARSPLRSRPAPRGVPAPAYAQLSSS